jgi:creatinine amidohydrolase/Fe(II)-dependent formamide hydrolase-like protein
MKKSSSSKPQASALDDLVVFDSMEIGPVRVERMRVTAPYTLVRGRKRQSTDFIYRFEDEVFDDSPGSRNLASMMAAQVALNYGLFCERLVFKGTYDEHDKRFLEVFAENTAREIYVNKFLMPNEFLIGTARDLPAERRKRYSRAAIEIITQEETKGTENWRADPAKHAVLSSGGKDSLLTFGVLRELGLQTDALFVNESGRHWYTALNAYRHFNSNHPATGRVWTNSDRIFAWMLRRLPFVRQDFSRVRSDEYPVRLWTVAVFIFGALPMLRERGIGRLLIGDEYDTTVKASHRGITHYSALFDQSRFFDEAMSRYYRRKGWGVSQFSILRPLSELLIQKILAERYPELQRHQLSCHATHIDGDRVLPCGECEKCRRIVGMLKAADADPTRCGYTARQIDRSLEALTEKGVHQEAEGREQLMHMLLEKGLIPASAAGKSGARSHPETLSLRFHPVKSPVASMPTDLRAGVYGLFLQHAAGALTKSGRLWMKYDPNGEQALAEPYHFDGPADSGNPARGDGKYLLAEMTWPEAEARFKETDVALLPVGAIEQHGPHLPLDVDAFDADLLAKRVAAGCSKPRPLVLPPLHYGVSYHHEGFSGTLSVNPDTLVRLAYDIGMGAARCGITKLVIINGHGGNEPALHLAAQRINRDAHIFTCVDTGESSDTDIDELIDTPNDVHAGEIETSTTLAVRPQLVDMSKAPRMVPRFSSRFLDFSSKRSISWYARTKKISRSGVMGDATKATAEKGERIWELMTSRLVELVEDLKRMSLDEIHQRRY